MSDENGNYFDPTTDYEDANALVEAKRLKKAQDYLQGQEIGKHIKSQTEQGTAEALKEFGVSPQEFEGLCGSSVPKVAKYLKDSSYKFAKKVIEKGRAAKGEGLVPVQQQGRAKAAGSYEKKMAAVQAKADKTGMVDSEEMIDILDALLG
ncbi:MAG: hypothetical protein ABIB65_01510 [Candidatus Margulisiibacteriota bacterium]